MPVIFGCVFSIKIKLVQRSTESSAKQHDLPAPSATEISTHQNSAYAVIKNDEVS